MLRQLKYYLIMFHTKIKSNSVVCMVLFACIVVWILYRFNAKAVNDAFTLYGKGWMTGTLNFEYSDTEVYKAVRRVAEVNCLQTYQNKTLCEMMLDCKVTMGNIMNRACKRRLPRAIIVGVYKSGTRELIDFLAMNPLVQIKRIPEYEISFFGHHSDKGLNWYKEQMPHSLDNQLTVEKSPSYFTSKTAPVKMFEMNQDLKLLLILREPVSRTFSQFSFDNHTAKYKYGGSFKRCLYSSQTNWQQKQNVPKKINTNCFAVKNSIYSEHLRNFLKYFSLQQIKIIEWKKLVTNPCEVLQGVEQFLSINPFIKCKDLIFNPLKKFYCVRDARGKFAGICYSATRGRNGTSSTDFDVMFKPYMKTLRQFFTPFNEQLYKIINRTFVW